MSPDGGLVFIHIKTVDQKFSKSSTAQSPSMSICAENY